MDYGKMLRQKRESLGLSRYKLSKLSGIPESTIQNWETGGIQPTVALYSKALEAMGESLVIGKQEK